MTPCPQAQPPSLTTCYYLLGHPIGVTCASLLFLENVRCDLPWSLHCLRWADMAHFCSECLLECPLPSEVSPPHIIPAFPQHLSAPNLLCRSLVCYGCYCLSTPAGMDAPPGPGFLLVSFPVVGLGSDS